jgi:hypothetical protein
MTRPRDGQRMKLYRAERIAWRAHPFHEGFENESEVLAFVQRILRSAWMRKRCYDEAETNIRVEFVARGTARTSGNTIMLPRWIWYKWTTERWGCTGEMVERGDAAWVVLHELAHVVANWEHGRKVAGHGREYARVYLALARRFAGRDAARALKAAFREAGVKSRRYAARPDLRGRCPARQARSVAVAASDAPGAPVALPALGEDPVDTWALRLTYVPAHTNL